MDRKLTTTELIILASGAVMFLFGFFSWYEIDVPGFAGLDAGDESLMAWDEGLFPLATYVPLIGLVAAGQILLDKYSNVSFDGDVLGFTWRQIHLALAIFAALIMFGFLISDTPDKGVGFWLDLLGTIGLVVGAVRLYREPSTSDSTGI